MMYINPVSGLPIFPRLAVPQSFGDAMSYTDQLLILAHGLQNVQTNVDTDHSNIYAQIKGVADSVAALAESTAGALAELRREIGETAVGTQIYDCFTGSYEENMVGMRDTVYWLAVHAITVGELNSLEGMDTVEDLRDCGLSCVGLAVLGQWLLGKGFTIPERYDPEGRATGAALTARDYPNLMLDATNNVYLAR